MEWKGSGGGLGYNHVQGRLSLVNEIHCGQSLQGSRSALRRGVGHLVEHTVGLNDGNGALRIAQGHLVGLEQKGNRQWWGEQ
jgi:hypothetical protein